MGRKMTKKKLIDLLQNDSSPDNTPVNITLECTNNDECIVGEVIGVTYETKYKEITLNGTYAEEY